MKHFSRDGLCQFGKHKGTHARALPKLWAEWACANVEGFREALATAITQETPPPPRLRRPTGRRYTLKPHLRYEPARRPV